MPFQSENVAFNCLPIIKLRHFDENDIVKLYSHELQSAHLTPSSSRQKTRPRRNNPFGNSLRIFNFPHLF